MDHPKGDCSAQIFGQFEVNVAQMRRQDLEPAEACLQPSVAGCALAH
jgi:hypothetical protein